MNIKYHWSVCEQVRDDHALETLSPDVPTII